jgi:O-antigen/teichoic acid export membrane protein
MFETAEIKRGLKNTSYLVAGNMGIYVISFFAAVYIARTLGPDNYGIYSTVTTFVAMFAFITLPGLNNTLVREGSRNPEKQGEVLKKVISIQIWLCLLAILIAIIASSFTSYSSNTKIFIGLFSVTLLINAIKLSLNSVYQATERMQFISIIDLVNYGLYALLAVIFIYLGYGVFALIVISITSNFISLVLNYKIFKRITTYKLSYDPIIESTLLKSGLIFSLIALFSFLYSRFDILMVSFFLTSNDVGLYSVGFRLVNVVEMVGNMVSLSFFPIVVKRFKNGAIPAKKLFQFSFLIFIVAFPICLVISSFSKQIILLLFGTQYLGADKILQIMIWVIVISNPAWPFIWSMMANNHEKKVLYALPLCSASNIIFNYFLLKKFGIAGIAYSTIITHLWYFPLVCFGYYYCVLKRNGNIL